jgi:glycosyltransferase 2 family protein
MSEPSSSGTRRTPTVRVVAKGLALVIVLVASVYFLAELFRHAEDLRSVQWSGDTALALGASLFGMLLVITLGGLMFLVLLRDQGARVGASVVVEIVFLSQMAKYLPGNMGHIIGQVSLATAAGVPLGIAMGSMLISTLWLLSLGLGMGALALMFFVEVPILGEDFAIGLPGMVLLGCVLATLPWLGIPVINRVFPGLSRKIGGGSLLTVPRLSTALALGLGFLLCFVIFGIMLKLQALLIFDVSEGDVVTLTFLFTAAWVAGYLMPGAPGGLGVREAVMLLLLTPVVGPAAAAGLGVTMRLVSVAGDGAAFVLGIVVRRIRKA